jgi:acetyl esterase
MTSENARKKAIRKGRWLQWIFDRLIFLFVSSKYKARRKQIVIDTPFGKARTLWYGLDNVEKLPLFIDLHGGGFLFGSPEMDEELNVQIQQELGCKVVGIEYAKAPNHPYPTAVNQVYAVVKHVVRHAEEFGIDVDRMAIGGYSAGGNLATVTCMKALESDDFKFVCQVLDYPPLDLATNAYEKPQPKGCIPPGMAEMFNACYVEPEQAKDPYVSPLFANAKQLMGLPPALVIAAGQDSLHDEAIKYAAILKSVGVVVQTEEYVNASHGFTLKSSADTIDAIAKMINFLKKYLFA